MDTMWIMPILLMIWCVYWGFLLIREVSKSVKDILEDERNDTSQ